MYSGKVIARLIVFVDNFLAVVGLQSSLLRLIHAQSLLLLLHLLGDVGVDLGLELGHRLAESGEKGRLVVRGGSGTGGPQVAGEGGGAVGRGGVGGAQRGHGGLVGSERDVQDRGRVRGVVRGVVSCRGEIGGGQWAVPAQIASALRASTSYVPSRRLPVFPPPHIVSGAVRWL